MKRPFQHWGKEEANKNPQFSSEKSRSLSGNGRSRGGGKKALYREGGSMSQKSWLFIIESVIFPADVILTSRPGKCTISLICPAKPGKRTETIFRSQFAPFPGHCFRFLFSCWRGMKIDSRLSGKDGDDFFCKTIISLARSFVDSGYF